LCHSSLVKTTTALDMGWLLAYLNHHEE
jgi:hypothetical protein